MTMNNKVKTMTIMSLGVLLVSSLFAISFVSVGASFGTYPVALTPSWTHKIWPVGSSPSISITAKNNGGQTFNSHTCYVYYVPPHGSPNTAHFACGFSVSPGGSAHHTYSLYPYHVKSSDCPALCGSWKITFWYSGTVGSKTYDSQQTHFTGCIVHC